MCRDFRHTCSRASEDVCGLKMLEHRGCLAGRGFVPEAWVISLIASSISVMTLSLLTSFTVAHLGLARRFAELEAARSASSFPHRSVFHRAPAVEALRCANSAERARFLPARRLGGRHDALCCLPMRPRLGQA